MKQVQVLVDMPYMTLISLDNYKFNYEFIRLIKLKLKKEL